MSSELKHYGVKGMQWGVRKARNEAARAQAFNRQRKAPTAVTINEKPGDYIQSKGGARQKASEDAIKTQKYRQTARASTTDSLSNRELQELVTRMNLEQQYTNLASQQDRRRRGVRTAHSILTKGLPVALGPYGPGSTASDIAVSALKNDMPATASNVATAINLAAKVTAGPSPRKGK